MINISYVYLCFQLCAFFKSYFKSISTINFFIIVFIIKIRKISFLKVERGLLVRIKLRIKEKKYVLHV